MRPVTFHTDGGDIGYIRIASFNEQTTDGLKKAIADISKQIPQDKLAGYVVDLRNNPGGLLDQAVSVSSAFMARGEVVSTRGRTPEETQRFTAQGGDLTKGKPLVVLINGGSASASEIVAGALHDHKRATLIGTRSFGKGSVQTIIPLGAGNGALALTTARYFTPSAIRSRRRASSPISRCCRSVPDELKDRPELKGEASMRGHLSAEGAEQTGSQSYVPPDEKDDKALARGLQPAARRHRQCRRAASSEDDGSELEPADRQAIGAASRPPAMRPLRRLCIGPRCRGRAVCGSSSCLISAAGLGGLNR